MPVSDQDLDTAKQKFVDNSNALAAIVQSDDTTDVDIGGGKTLPSVAKLQKQVLQDYAHVEQQINRDASNGYPALTGFKLNLQNVAGAVKSYLRSIADTSRTWTMPDKDGTVAMLSDITAVNVGLDQVNNTSDINKPISTPTAAALAARELLTNKAVDFTTVNDTLFPTLQAVKTYVDNSTSAVLRDCGNWSGASGTYPNAGGTGAAGAIRKGDTFYINVAGNLGGVAVNIGDSVRAMINAPGQTAANWNILESNIGYVPENAAGKDTTGGYAGLTLFKLNVLNAAGNVKSFFTTVATVARTYTLPDKDGTIAMTSDITGTNSGTNTGDETVGSIKTKLGITTLSGSNTGDQTLASLAAEGTANKDASGGYAGLTLFKLNLKNAAGAITSFLTNANTAARTYNLPDYDATLATVAGTETLTNKTMSGVTISGFIESGANPAAGNAFTPDLSAGSDFEYTLNANGTITMPAVVVGKSFTLTINYTGAQTVAFNGATIRWVGGSAPSATSANGKLDMYTFKAKRDGTAWIGADGGRGA
jgi:hypothetical protein